ncbi:MAG: RNA 2',3'-cyclic phosphodiesterase [Gammaproteobacteria bacterium]|nr:RNA 2',3'-cyclic phosphodiesterase [Gammaproteobacteria bacterium]
MNDKKITRLFLALWPDQVTRERLAGIQGQFSGRPGRFNHPQDLHITLVFLGPVAEERMSSVIDAVERVSLKPFSLSIDRVADWKRPRILWCGPTNTPPPLVQLVADLEKALSDCGFPPEKRRYTPHVTLVRKAPPIEAGQLKQPIVWSVDSMVLVCSGGQSPGPRYGVLKKWRMDS